jgi:NADPH-dependent ferric siderophore reductase
MANSRTVSVLRREDLSPNMVRMVLTGSELDDFPTGYESGYVKLMFPSGNEKPIVRSYTVRKYEENTRELTLDMVVHGDTGPAAKWANHVCAGETIQISGPGACKKINLDADWFFLAGDMSAVPAISVNLQTLPYDAVGYVVLEVISERDQFDLTVPPGMEVRWVINSTPELQSTILEDAVMALPWQEGQAAVWVAGEFASSRTLRHYFRQVRGVPREHMYVSCYWKMGDTDEEMKQAKRADTDSW